MQKLVIGSGIAALTGVALWNMIGSVFTVPRLEGNPTLRGK